eukprot:gene7337-14979_t
MSDFDTHCACKSASIILDTASWVNASMKSIYKNPLLIGSMSYLNMPQKFWKRCRPVHQKPRTWMLIYSITFSILFSKLALVQSTPWLQFSFDLQRTGHNPNDSSIRPDSFSSNTFVPFWDVSINGGGNSQPLLSEDVMIQGGLKNLIYVGTHSGYYYAIDASTGSIIWKRDIGAHSGSSCSTGQQTLGGSTGLIDKSSSSIFVVSSNGNLNRLLTTTGAQYSTSWPMVSIFDPSIYQSHGAITMYLNTVYVPLSCRCSNSTTYQGKLLAFEIDPSMSVVYTQSFIPSSPYYGGGISGAGG